ncbi:MAG: DUF485 domain-containing protein [Gammaproteobacteria bacterium]|nr:DUF485 domain-containing protein [Gammaproteobacteria bacterium]
MSKQHYEHIRNNEKFQDLVARRSKLSWTLAVLILVVYYSFILVIAFSPELFGVPISDGSTITWGIIIGIAIILFTFVITGVYVHKANTSFDQVLLDVVDASHDHVNSQNSNESSQGDQ